MAEFDLAAVLTGYLNQYGKQVREEVSDLIDETSSEMLKEIKANSPVGSGESNSRYQKIRYMKSSAKGLKGKGKYRKGWRMETDISALGKKTVTIYNKTDYQLTHLLEKSHLTRDGTTRTTPKPHIKPAEEKYTEKFVEGVEEIIKNAGRSI